MDVGHETALAAWHDACARLSALGDDVVSGTFPNGDSDRVDAVAHLAQQAMCWIGWSVFHADPRRPFFHRQNDLTTQWGGPCADNIYRHVRIDPSRRYRITGKMNSCDDFIVAIRCGFMHQPTWGTVHETYAHRLGITAGDEFELFLGGEPRAERWVPIPEGAVMASFREYYLDWGVGEPAFMTIECLDDDVDAPASRLPATELAARLDDAVAGIEHSIRKWNDYLNEHRAGATDNVMASPMKVAKGLDTARYAFCFWNLSEDEALVLETTVPDARYWSFQLYEMGTYELLDIVERQTSLNLRQVSIDDDGKVRIVIARRDPGIANWLDAADRPVGQFTFRYFWSNADPEFSTRVVRLDDLDSELPVTTKRVTPEERRAVQAARRRHLAWRYRT